MRGPYFKGQTAADCGHYYPDVLRIMDFKDDCRTLRVYDCRECGGFVTTEVILSEDIVTPRDVRDIDSFREKEIQRLTTTPG